MSNVLNEATEEALRAKLGAYPKIDGMQGPMVKQIAGMWRIVYYDPIESNFYDPKNDSIIDVTMKAVDQGNYGDNMSYGLALPEQKQPRTMAEAFMMVMNEADNDEKNDKKDDDDDDPDVCEHGYTHGCRACNPDGGLNEGYGYKVDPSMQQGGSLDLQYAKRLDSVQSNMKRLQKLVDHLTNDPKVGWGTLGSLGHVDERIKEILEGWQGKF